MRGGSHHHIGYQRDDRFVPCHHHPALLLEMVREQGLDDHKALRHTGLFPDDLLDTSARLSPRQYLQLVHNIRRLHPDPELGFRYGQTLLPGHYGAISTLLGNAAHLDQALITLEDYQPLITPLLAPRIIRTGEYCCVQWLDSCGAGNEYRFLVESMMSALASVTRWLSGGPLPWTFQFSYPQPDYPEHYQVYLGAQLYFEAQMDAMLIPAHYLNQPWPRGSHTARAVSEQQCQEQQLALGCDTSLVHQLYLALIERIREPPSLDTAARELGLSPATLKRKLKHHGTHFQDLLDRARKHTALHLLQFYGYNSEQVARYLRFNDNTNFRRSFKRWTGLTPRACQQLVDRAMTTLKPL
ncbi:AraC family transcriptional regulator [Alloalcanivorax xenomutans]|uniref:AraC family transcriptional regulator n=1 Tax=Alloalcanivorax xenomutans TaxID=1094342 RepID=UPI002931C0C1|nr:AraC family transcriptional regulator [Alloalcanivorax xenomutans]WOA31083.1 AraC family transcriptional regulator [Alloalcanivorax xenomutans]